MSLLFRKGKNNIMKRIVTIQDISGVGKCSLTVALPIISAMGVETSVLPTAVLSTHTAFKDFTFRDLTSDIQPILKHWKDQKFTFDAIYTGYLGSKEQIDLMSNMFDYYKKQGTLILVDPCMADNGSLYPGFTKGFAHEMAGLCGKADIIVPNMTEASYLLDIPYVENGYDEAYVKDILQKLAALGAKKVAIKGITLKEGLYGVYSYDSTTKEYTSYYHKRLQQNFHGTGDIFASVVVGALMKDYTLEKALSLAADYVVESIEETLKSDNPNWYGVNFETAFPYLLKRLYQ